MVFFAVFFLNVPHVGFLNLLTVHVAAGEPNMSRICPESCMLQISLTPQTLEVALACYSKPGRRRAVEGLEGYYLLSPVQLLCKLRDCLLWSVLKRKEKKKKQTDCMSVSVFPRGFYKTGTLCIPHFSCRVSMVTAAMPQR